MVTISSFIFHEVDVGILVMSSNVDNPENCLLPLELPQATPTQTGITSTTTPSTTAPSPTTATTPITLTEVPIMSTTEEIACVDTNGLSSPTYIKDEWIKTTDETVPGYRLRPLGTQGRHGEEVFESSAILLVITVQLSENYDVSLGSLHLIVHENIKSFMIMYSKIEADHYKPFGKVVTEWYIIFVFYITLYYKHLTNFNRYSSNEISNINGILPWNQKEFYNF